MQVKSAMPNNVRKTPSFRLRQNPLKLGPNFNAMSKEQRHEIELTISKNAETLRLAEQNNYKTPDGENLKHGLSMDYKSYCDFLGVDILGVFKTLEKKQLFGDCPAILDVGCGLAVAARQMQQFLGNRAKVFGLDIHLFKQTNVKRELPEIPVIRGMMESFPFMDNNLFALVLNNILNFSLYPFSTLDETIRVLKPYGVSFFHFSTDKTERERLEKPMFSMTIKSLKLMAEVDKKRISPEFILPNNQPSDSFIFGIMKPPGLENNYFSRITNSKM